MRPREAPLAPLKGALGATFAHHLIKINYFFGQRNKHWTVLSMSSGAQTTPQTVRSGTDVRQDWLWIPHERHVWVPGTIVRSKTPGGETHCRHTMHVQTQSGEQLPIPELKRGQTRPRGTGSFDGQVKVFSVPKAEAEERDVACFRWSSSLARWERSGPLLHVTPNVLQRHFDNLGDMESMEEAPCNWQLRRRYLADDVYTQMGHILVALNPYKLLPIYSSRFISAYINSSASNPPPAHIFATASRAYRALTLRKRSQAVIISGESGSGKTESTKLILQFLGEASRRAARRGTGSPSGLEQEVLLANPILEAFGNAKTVRNDNSSRFGKWVEVGFAPNNAISAARIHVYLLERSRVVRHGAGERNYHVFYMLTGCAPDAWADLGVGNRHQNFAYLRPIGDDKTNSTRADMSSTNTGDQGEFKALLNRMKGLHFTTKHIRNVFQVVAAVLHLGNLEFSLQKEKKKAGRQFVDVAEVLDRKQLDRVCALLHVDPDALERALAFRKITVAGEETLSPWPLGEVLRVRDAMAKALYGRLFSWLVKRINHAISAGDAAVGDATVGVLDIFGFEVFRINSFEQFCINFANEKLQSLFQHHVFLSELREYEAEGVSVSGVDFPDNRGCLELIENKKSGIISMLAEEAALPKRSDAALVAKMHARFVDKSKFYREIKKAPQDFVIRHYAGDVCYATHGFLQKDNDFLSGDAIRCLEESSHSIIKNLFSREEPTDSSVPDTTATGDADATDRLTRSVLRPSPNTPQHQRPTRTSTTRRRRKTVSAQFRAALSSLMAKLQSAEPQYVRCIKPNSNKRPNVYESCEVLRQVRYAGLLQAIRLRRAGFPFRVSHKDFERKYALCGADATIGNTAVADKKYSMDTKIGASPPPPPPPPPLDETDSAQPTTPKSSLRQRVQRLLRAMWPSLTRADPAITHGQYNVGKTKVFMKSRVYSALNTIWKDSMRNRVVRAQAMARGWLARTRFFRLLRVYRSGQFAAQTRDLVQLESALAGVHQGAVAELQEVNPGFVRKLRQLKRFLESQREVLQLFREACESKDIDRLKAAKIRVTLLSSDYPDQKHSEALVKARGRAEAIMVEIETTEAVRALLRTARVLEDPKSIQFALTKAQNTPGLVGSDDVTSAQTLLLRLQREEKTLNALLIAVSEHSGRDMAPEKGGESQSMPATQNQTLTLEIINEIELLAEPVRALPATAARQAAVSASDRIIEEGLTALIEESMKKGAKSDLQEQLIPRAGALGFADLENRGLEWLASYERAHAEAQAKQKAQKEREKEVKIRQEQTERVSSSEPMDHSTNKCIAKTAESADPTTKPTTQQHPTTKNGPEKLNTDETKTTELSDFKPFAPSDAKGPLSKHPIGSTIRVCGLKNNTEFNGLAAEVDDYDSVRERFLVRLFRDGSLLGVRLNNMAPLDASRAVALRRRHEMEATKQKRISAIGTHADGVGSDGGPFNPLPETVRARLLQATERQNAAELRQILDSAVVSNCSQDRETRMAKAVLAALDLEAAAREGLTLAIADIRTSHIRHWLSRAQGLDAQAQLRIKPLVDRGRHIAYLMTKQELLLLKLRRALEDLDTRKLKHLLRFANTAWLRAQKEVLQAESFLQANPDVVGSQNTRRREKQLHLPSSSSPSYSPTRSYDSQSRAVGSQGKSSAEHKVTVVTTTTTKLSTDETNHHIQKRETSPRGTKLTATPLIIRQFNDAMNGFRKLKGLHPLGSLLLLRPEASYLKKVFFSRKYHRKHRLRHQAQPIPHSMVELHTASHEVKQRAKHMFKNILYFTGEVYHAFPVSLGHEVVQEATREPLLQTEVVCQLIKQSTRNPNLYSSVRVWKLLYMSLHAFEPCRAVRLCILSHAAKHADLDIDMSSPTAIKRLHLLNSVETIATLILILDFQRPLRPWVPELAAVRQMTENHTLPRDMAPPLVQALIRKLGPTGGLC